MVIWPYASRREYLELIARNTFNRLVKAHRPTIFFTAENLPPNWHIAGYQIGFQPDIKDGRYLRFPNWQLHLYWPELPSQPPHNRFGTRLNTEVLMRPMSDTHDFSCRKERAVMFSSHLREPRESIYRLASDILGCDGFGKVFNEDTRLVGGKYDICKKYAYALCPENSIGPGYITEKIPEAFYSGCIPITWCRPEDLELEFNSGAVVNLYGLSEEEKREILEKLKTDHTFREGIRAVPLLKRRPSIEPLLSFVRRAEEQR